jgi:hypothetical protein
MQTDAFGRPLDPDAPQTVGCTACDGRAERLSSAWQGEGVVYHHYRCRADGCPAGGTIVEHENGGKRRVGPVFRAPRSHNPAYRDDHPADGGILADEREQAAETPEVRV